MDSSLSRSPWWSGFNDCIRLRESSESEPAVYSYSNLLGSGEHFSIVLKPLLTEQRTIGDGRHPDFSNDLCVSVQVSVRSLPTQVERGEDLHM